VSDQPKFKDGELVVYGTDRDGAPELCLVNAMPREDASRPWRYGMTYVERPELGYPVGGASFSWPEDRFRRPETAWERLLVLQYRRREAAISLAKQAREAEATANAVDVALAAFLEDRIEPPAGDDLPKASGEAA
jgi:hypothetical protein